MVWVTTYINSPSPFFIVFFFLSLSASNRNWKSRQHNKHLFKRGRKTEDKNKNRTCEWRDRGQSRVRNFPKRGRTKSSWENRPKPQIRYAPVWPIVQAGLPDLQSIYISYKNLIVWTVNYSKQYLIKSSVKLVGNVLCPDNDVLSFPDNDRKFLYSSRRNAPHRWRGSLWATVTVIFWRNKLKMR